MRRLLGPRLRGSRSLRWSRRHSSLVRCALALALVSVLVVLTCYTAWAQLAGRQLVLSDRTGSLTWPPAIRDLRVDHTADPTIHRTSPVGGTRDLRASSSAESSRTSGAASTTLDGTTLAATVSLLAIGVGLMVQRAILLRPRRRDRAPQPTLELVAAAGDDEAPDLELELDGEPEAEPDQSSEHQADHPLAAEDHDGPELGLAQAATPGCAAATSAGVRGAPIIPAGRSDAVTEIGSHTATQTRGGHGRSAQDPPSASLISSTATGDPVDTTPGDLDLSSARTIVYDRREHLRVSFQSRARLQWEGHDVACETLNLDLLGVRCVIPPPRTEATLPPGTPVRITLLLDGVLLPTTARVTSTVTEEGQWRVGLRFDTLEDHHRTQLLCYLDEQSA